MNHHQWAWCPVCKKQLGPVGEACPTCSNVFVPHDPLLLTKGDWLWLVAVVCMAIMIIAAAAVLMVTT